MHILEKIRKTLHMEELETAPPSLNNSDANWWEGQDFKFK